MLPSLHYTCPYLVMSLLLSIHVDNERLMCILNVHQPRTLYISDIYCNTVGVYIILNINHVHCNWKTSIEKYGGFHLGNFYIFSYWPLTLCSFSFILVLLFITTVYNDMVKCLNSTVKLNIRIWVHNLIYIAQDS